MAALPLMFRAATSCARAAISGVGKVPSQILDFFLGSLISETHLPQFRMRTPWYDGCLLCSRARLVLLVGEGVIDGVEEEEGEEEGEDMTSPNLHFCHCEPSTKTFSWMEISTPSPLNHRSHLHLHHHQIRALLLTFLAYSSFHASRKPPSIIKSVLAPDPLNSPSSSSWPPFNTTLGPHRLGELDLAFLSSYSAGMFLSGLAADRLNIRLLLSYSMFSTSIATAAFGLAFWLDIHRLSFFVVVQVAAGFLQSVGWPCVVSVVGNWFGGSSRRGLIMGIWNSHTSVGNIVGSVLASCVVGFGWGWSFVAPAVVVGLVGVLVFVFLVPHPRDLGVEMEGSLQGLNGGDLDFGVSEETGLLESGFGEEKAIGFLEAWRLPSVAAYACCLFFSKLVAYTFLYWLPFYIRHTAVAGVHLTHTTSGILSTVFDVGGVIGGVSAGFISDWLGARAITSVMFLTLSVPSLILYRMYGSISMYFNAGLMFLSGFFVNGPYSLITTAVSADLGTQGSIKGNSRALATITAIIDGTGSIGAALGPLLTGYISTWGWNNVFIMLIFSNSLAVMCLIHIAKDEIVSRKQQKMSSTSI